MDDAIRLRKSLHNMLTQAEIDFEMWQAMRKDLQFNMHIKQRYSRFFIAAENSLFNSLIIILYKALENRSDTINVNQYKNSFSGRMPSATENEIQTLFSGMQDTKAKICILRNNVIGHQSMKLNTLDAFDRVNLWTLEIRQLIADLQQLIFVLARDMQDIHVDFNIKGTKDFDNLVRDLRDNR